MLGGALSALVGITKTLGRTVSAGPALLLKRRKALDLFARGLRAQGLDPEAVKELTAAYKNLGSLESWFSRPRE